MNSTTIRKPLYYGEGVQAKQAWANIRPVDPWPLTDPSKYMASPELAEAVNVALDLGMPLLLTGEPGCGKSELASSIAWELDFPLLPEQEGPYPEPLRFTVKSDTQSSDLFYRFDTLGRFHKKEGGISNPKEFITYEALGKAILYARKRDDEIDRKLMRDADRQKLPQQPCSCVVLIDEIDKAPREVPNDILNEIQKLSFKIPELFGEFDGEVAIDKNNRFRPFIVITSNEDRPLPKAFLRRCVYLHMQPPDYRGEKYSIESIVKTRLFQRFVDEAQQSLMDDAISLYAHLRKNGKLEKNPSVAELLAWVYYLSRQRNEAGQLPTRQDAIFKSSARHTLLKLSKDQAKFEGLIGSWVNGS
jgi:MoxR-like ATPase